MADGKCQSVRVPAHKSSSGPSCFLPPPTSLSGVCPPHEGGFSCITDLLLPSLLLNNRCFAYASVVSTTGARLVWACSPLWGPIYLVYHRLPKVSASYLSSRLAGRSSQYLMSSVHGCCAEGLGRGVVSVSARGLRTDMKLHLVQCSTQQSFLQYVEAG